MARALSRASAQFTEHYLDLGAPGAVTAVARQITEVGLVTTDGLTSREAVLAAAGLIMEVTAHRDSDPDGLTVIRDTRHHQHRAGFAGLGRDELAVHTESSGVPDPPRLMLLACLQPAPEGGECLLVDGRAVYGHLSQHCPEAALRLGLPRTAYFGAGDGHATQVFTRHADERVSVRLRQDSLARFNPTIQPHLPQLRAAVAVTQHAMALDVGQGYLIDNHRWLHARRRFTGERLCLRALGHARFPLPVGFLPHTSVDRGR
ncbi:TauD/TfdA family dioxygenase [Streptomyces sp. NPDC018045]|uniref:TauD/TfdA family dioxygenase n=1 Tax=Streptomyces sp. NPDC018045 TaxID=3365037 RepID=UPI00378A76EF